MKWISKIHQMFKEWRCNHVYIDLQRIGFERCVFCDKEKPKNLKK
jgi:hypothetical protein